MSGAMGAVLLSALMISSVVQAADTEQGDLRLFRGSSTTGVLQIYHNTTWTLLCGQGFTDKEARVACRQLGYDSGTALPRAAYGLIEGLATYPREMSGCATGAELRLEDCTFTAASEKCAEIYSLYASVNCYNGNIISKDPPIRLDNGNTPGAGYFSKLSVFEGSLWIHINADFWSDANANVSCRQLGYIGGVAAEYTSDWSTPRHMTKIDCVGTEDKLSDCPRESSLGITSNIAGVICYRNQGQGPGLRLVDGGRQDHGKVQFSIDGQTGFICNDSFSANEAIVVCLTMGYKYGTVITMVWSPAQEEVVLAGLQCHLGDETIYQCSHSGWKNTSGSCGGVASVHCWGDVKLTGHQDAGRLDQLVYGNVHVLSSDHWYYICADIFTQQTANVMCRLMGYNNVEILTAISSVSPLGDAISSITCQGNETSFGQCEHTVGACSSPWQAAALICTVASISQNELSDVSLLDKDYRFEYTGIVQLKRFGIAGSICPEGWDDNDAHVTCRLFGYTWGVAISLKIHRSSFVPVWAGNFTCSGSETNLLDCTYSTDLTKATACYDNKNAVGVLCYRQKPDSLVRLKGSTGFNIRHVGRVEVYHDISGWGTVCSTDNKWGTREAQVVCRQLGYADGQAASSGFTKGSSSQVVVLGNIDCDGTETSILQCQSYGWRQHIPQTCSDHSRDVGVYCYKYVDVYPHSPFGAVRYHSTIEYGLVCADGFDNIAAGVVCKNLDLAYNYGKVVCCSALGPDLKDNLDFTLSDVKCDGTEKSLHDCKHGAVGASVAPSCGSGQYAAVVCSHVNSGYQGLEATPVVEIKYFLNKGYLCSDNFTDNDARVVCRTRSTSMSYGRAYRADARGLEQKLRWLSGLGCSGSETAIQQCSSLLSNRWGQIGVCSWESVAGVICSNNEDDQEVSVRLVNGASNGMSGNLEVKVKGQWGSVCGKHFTQAEPNVICKQLGTHGGISKSAGTYGTALGKVMLGGLRCKGDEDNITDCFWSGLDGTNTGCDQSLAAIQCYNKVRLSGSTREDYGRLEIYTPETQNWAAVCDRNINIYHATLLCRQLGYKAGMFQKGSPLGLTEIAVTVTAIACNDPNSCTFTTGQCTGGTYLAMYCSNEDITNENFAVRLPLSSYYGPVSVSRYGLWGHVCSDTFEDNDARVVCGQLGYLSGVSLKTWTTAGFPIIQGAVQCAGNEKNLADCTRGAFIDGHECSGGKTVAAVMCYNDANGIKFSVTTVDVTIGKMVTNVALKLNGKTMNVDGAGFTDTNAAVYCKGSDFAGGDNYRFGSGSYGVSDIKCSGVESSILLCPGNWDPSKNANKQGDIAGAVCYTSVRLERGNSKNYGVVFTSRGVNSGPVCGPGFDEKDAGVVCKNLVYDSGLVICCGAFGLVEEEPVLTNMQCTGTERQFTDCKHDSVDPSQRASCQNNYAAVACYNGGRPTAYTLTLADPDSNSGHLIVNYMGINGSVCVDGWGDTDAHVACKDLGYTRGIAYIVIRFKETIGPFWTSNVNCQGTEPGLDQCAKTDIGQVTGCSNLQHHAGVTCFDNEGVFYRLTGSSDPRYGRVEMSLNGVWRPICNQFWDNKDAQVFCKMREFRTGEAYYKMPTNNKTGAVWDLNLQCDGTENMLNACPSYGWRLSTNPDCMRGDSDAAVFCYRSVKLHSGVGRETDLGAVLYYRNDRWYTVCSDGFSDVDATVVCRELGFTRGTAPCCEKWGQLNYPKLNSHQVNCSGEEEDFTDCLVEMKCESQSYASVLCFSDDVSTTEVIATMPEPIKDNNGLTIAIIVIVCVLIVIVIVCATIYIIRCRRRQKRERAASQTFDTSIVREHMDGSLMVTNQLHGLVHTPEVQRVQFNSNKNNTGAGTSVSYTNPDYGSSQGAIRNDYLTPQSNAPHSAAPNNAQEDGDAASKAAVQPKSADTDITHHVDNAVKDPEKQTNTTVIQVPSYSNNNRGRSLAANGREIETGGLSNSGYVQVIHETLGRSDSGYVQVVAPETRRGLSDSGYEQVVVPEDRNAADVDPAELTDRYQRLTPGDRAETVNPYAQLRLSLVDQSEVHSPRDDITESAAPSASDESATAEE